MGKGETEALQLESTTLGHDILEEPMKFIGFKLERSSADCVEGRFVVSKKSCQPFNVLHGGVSALVAESLASVAAHIASGFQRVAGVELSINHLKAAPIGTEVFASAKPIHVGKRLHVWDVTLWKVPNLNGSSSNLKPEEGTKLAVSRVTLMVGLTGDAGEYDRQLKIFSRL